VRKVKKKPGRPLKGDSIRKRVSFTLPAEVYAQLRAEARKYNMPASQIVERRLSSSDSAKLDSAKLLLKFSVLKRQIDQVASKYQIQRLFLYGSFLHQTDTAESDVDLLVEFKEGQIPGLFGVSKIEEELSNVLSGKKVDLRTAEDLSPYFRNKVQSEAVSIYEA